MASLATLRTLFYAYLGTVSTDPFYPSSVVDALLNSAANTYAGDIQEANPSYLAAVTTLVASSDHLYALPISFARVLDLRVTDQNGRPLTECSSEALNEATAVAAYAITGPDDAAVLQTSQGVDASVNLYLKYTVQPDELVADGDIPTWMPAKFHDLLARSAAIDAYGLGNEQQPSPTFMRATEDRQAQFYLHITQRSTSASETR